MRNKQTQEQWIEKAKKVHGNKYSYELSVYIGSDDPITVTCHEHGNFTSVAYSILRGKGCPTCGRIRVGVKRTEVAKSLFVGKAEKVHNNAYTYSISNYKNSRSKITVVCSEHGPFQQVANEHLKGFGCYKCSRVIVGRKLRKSQEDFIKGCLETHGDRYDYSNTVYTSGHLKIEVICKDHGPFVTGAIGHRQGKGCPSCAKSGYKTTLPGNLYILSCGDITKVGITNGPPEKRAGEVSNSASKSFTVIGSFSFDSGLVANSIETQILRELRKTHKRVSASFNGSTECFMDVDTESLKLKIQQLIQEHKDANQQ